MSAVAVLLSPRTSPVGAPCAGCGFCCQNEACELSRTLMHSAKAPCIALEWDGSRYRCGIVNHPHKYMLDGGKQWADPWLTPLIHRALGVGLGCDRAKDWLERRTI